jgi:hypothetical protein
MATNKKKAIAKTTTRRAHTFRPAQPFSVSTVRGRLGLSRKMFSRLAGSRSARSPTGRAESR